MKYLIFIFLFINSFTYAQENIFYIKDVDKAPTLNVCPSNLKHNKDCFLNALNSYVSDRLILPFDSLNNPIEGKVKAYLLFDKTGELKIKTVRSKNKTLQKNTQKLFDDFPRFKPAIINDKEVSMILVYPINYTFSTIPNKLYSLNQVKPPQIKNYKKYFSDKDLKSKYQDFINSFLIKANFKGHEVSTGHFALLFSYEIDTIGKVSNFIDLIEPNSKYEKTLNKKALKSKGFLIPATIANYPVILKDTINLMGIARKKKSLGYKTIPTALNPY